VWGAPMVGNKMSSTCSAICCPLKPGGGKKESTWILLIYNNLRNRKQIIIWNYVLNLSEAGP
jgi:hypothetical protein